MPQIIDSKAQSNLSDHTIYEHALKASIIIDDIEPFNMKQWKWITNPQKKNKNPFCIAIDGSIAEQIIEVPLNNINGKKYTFNAVRVCAQLWPENMFNTLKKLNLWSPINTKILRGSYSRATGFVPGKNVGFDGEITGLNAFYKASQSYLETPWKTFNFEKIYLTEEINYSPADTLKRLFEVYVENNNNKKEKQENSKPTDIHNKLFICACTSGKNKPSYIQWYEYGETQSKHLSCQNCQKKFTISDVLNLKQDTEDNGFSNLGLKLMELIEALMFVEVGERLKKTLHLNNKSIKNPFVILAEAFGYHPKENPICLIKDGPLRLPPINKLPQLLKNWTEQFIIESNGSICVFGIEKNSYLKTHVEYALKTNSLKKNKYYIPSAKEISSIEGFGNRDKTYWGDTCVITTKNGGAITISIPKINNTNNNNTKNSVIAALTLGVDYPKNEVFFPILKSLQAATALATRDKEYAKTTLYKMKILQNKNIPKLTTITETENKNNSTTPNITNSQISIKRAKY